MAGADLQATSDEDVPSWHHRPLPPRPASRPDHVPFWQYLRLFRRDILSAQPERLYAARMAEFRTPFFHSFLVNQPSLVQTVLKARPDDFPKSDRVREGLTPLLGRSVFVTNGDVWKRQRRIIDPAFEGGRLRQTFPAMVLAAEASVERLRNRVSAGDPVVEIEEEASFAAADVIFRTLFSIPIEDRMAHSVFEAFRAHQRTQPLLNAGAFLPIPRWMPRFHRAATRRTAHEIRRLVSGMVMTRAEQIKTGTAPRDLATKIMTTADPETGDLFEPVEMVDQVAIFFLAGHETSASALAWGLYLLACNPDVQSRVMTEASTLPSSPEFQHLSRLPYTRDVFREVLRLYPPVPFMVREATQTEHFRDRFVPKGAQIVLSPWHLHRHRRIWSDPDAFIPERWSEAGARDALKEAYIPFSAGPRVCTGAGFAMAEGVLLLATLVRAFQFAPVKGEVPIPVAHLTVRSSDGIRVSVTPRGAV